MGLSKRWWISPGPLLGVFIGYTISQLFFPFLRLGVTILILASGGLAGWLIQKVLFAPLKNFIKKIPVQVILIQSFGVLFGLILITLIAAIARPYFNFITLQTRLITGAILIIGIFGGLASIIWLKFRELSYIFFDITGQPSSKVAADKNQFKILDTSAIIDGRIADLCQTGFLEGILIIPSFVLNELQKIADSADSLRRNRGRRGLDLLNKIQRENHITIRIFDRDYEELTDVDTKLLKLAREIEAKVITNDFNLNKVAELYGVQVLNINDLANAIKPAVLPGEEMLVRILRDGKEFGQGIGYLEDGTMIVVEGGKNYIGIDLEVLVTSVLQTSAGRMIFAKPKEYLMTKETS
jgi:uncharacterized protein YacL